MYIYIYIYNASNDERQSMIYQLSVLSIIGDRIKKLRSGKLMENYTHLEVSDLPIEPKNLSPAPSIGRYVITTATILLILDPSM